MVERCGYLGDGIATGQRDHRMRINPVLPDRTGRQQRLWPTHEEVGQGDRIHADVEQRAASLLHAPEPVGGRGDEAEAALDVPDGADRSGSDRFLQRDDGRIELRPHRFHQEHLFADGECGEASRLGGVSRQRLLAENVLTGLDRLFDHREMGARWCTDVDDVDLVVCEQFAKSPNARGTPKSVAKRSAFAWLRELTARTSTFSASRRSGSVCLAISPVPATPQRVTACFISVPSTVGVQFQSRAHDTPLTRAAVGVGRVRAREPRSARRAGSSSCGSGPRGISSPSARSVPLAD